MNTNPYNPADIEQKWQQYWRERNVYTVSNDSSLPPYYVLDMFPYPSGAGLHVGHPRGYVGSDVFARAKRMQGYNVLHPMGFDSFGLPAEQYAIKTGNHPGPHTDELIVRYREQLEMIGFSYDWDRAVATHEPDYYRWTQWIFIRLFNHYYDRDMDRAVPVADLIKRFASQGNADLHAVCNADAPVFTASQWNGYSELQQQAILMNYRLAYEGYAEVNWCPELGTVLANDEVVTNSDGRMVSERGDYPVERRSMRQWFLRITAYADRLLSGLDGLDWRTSVKEVQRNWIGRSQGAEIQFELRAENSELIEKEKYSVTVFTTRADTLFGATYVVLAPEHSLVTQLSPYILNGKEVLEYVSWVASRGEDDRIAAREKTGVELQGITAINPANGESIPVWIADYVLSGYGTGAVMAVPAHDERDFEFAKKYDLPIRCVISPDGVNENPELPYTGDGVVINSDTFSQLPCDRARAEISAQHKQVTKYKMRDAIFARQRYWGEPIPLRHRLTGGTGGEDALIAEPLVDDELPLLLPDIEKYEPTPDGQPPLARSRTWVDAGYETNTMPGWAGSSWYWLRYMDPYNDQELASQNAIQYWKHVDMYVGGTEHATGHLLYSRFWNMFLYDIGIAHDPEPFHAMRNQGLILASDGRKMSKRWGNTVTPDEMVERFGADSFRLYECFIGPFDASQPWIIDGVVGCRRFLEKVWRVGDRVSSQQSIVQSGDNIQKILHKTIKKVTEDIADFKFNTAVPVLMELATEMDRTDVSVEDYTVLLKLLAPFAPHITEELYRMTHNQSDIVSIHTEPWPDYNPDFIHDDTVTLSVQINGKPRDTVTVSVHSTDDEILNMVYATTGYQKWVADVQPKKVIIIPGKVVSIIV